MYSQEEFRFPIIVVSQGVCSCVFVENVVSFIGCGNTMWGECPVVVNLT